jgi:hypothetical protein
MARRWFKIWIEEWETGSIRVDMDSAERGFWADMIGCAMKSRVEGLLCRDSKGEIAYTPSELATKYDVPIETVNSTIAKRLKDGSIIIDGNGVINLVNIWKYQSKIDKKEKGNGSKPASRTQTERDVKSASFAISNVNKAWDMAREGKTEVAESLLSQAMAVAPEAASQQWRDLWLNKIHRSHEARGK